MKKTLTVFLSKLEATALEGRRIALDETGDSFDENYYDGMLDVIYMLEDEIEKGEIKMKPIDLADLYKQLTPQLGTPPPTSAIALGCETFAHLEEGVNCTLIPLNAAAKRSMKKENKNA